MNKLKKIVSKICTCSTIFLLFLVSCVERTISQLSAEEGILKIKDLHHHERWDETVRSIEEYQSRYPYSAFGAEAELIEADSYFQSKKFAEAIVSYEEFLKKHPNHAQAALASYRMAECYDRQSGDAIDREQDYSVQALNRYQVFLKKFPTSTKAPEAQERLKTLRRRIAEHSAFIARFYWEKELYAASLNRYLHILKNYGEYEDLNQEARIHTQIGYEELAKSLENKTNDGDDNIYTHGSKTADELRAQAKTGTVQSSVPPK